MVIIGSTEGNLTSKAVKELHEVAGFLYDNAEALVGDMDSTYVLHNGLHFEFTLLEHDSIGTVKVSKEHIVARKPGK